MGPDELVAALLKGGTDMVFFGKSRVPPVRLVCRREVAWPEAGELFPQRVPEQAEGSLVAIRESPVREDEERIVCFFEDGPEPELIFPEGFLGGFPFRDVHENPVIYEHRLLLQRLGDSLEPDILPVRPDKPAFEIPGRF